MAKVVDGKKLAFEIEAELRKKVTDLGKKKIFSKLVSIIVGDDPSSHLYVSLKQKAAQRVGLKFEKRVFPLKVEDRKVKEYIERKNKDRKTDGIMVQMPIYDRKGKRSEVRALKIIESIDPQKDVDCLTPTNFGLLALGTPRFLPATVEAVMIIFKREKIKVTGKNIVVIGVSNIVGKPLAMILKNLNERGTVTICHSRTKNLSAFTRKADILVSATGVKGLVKERMVKERAVVIDVGERRDGGTVVGDVDFEKVKEKASLITPVPGGVGPLTVISLLKNTVLAAQSKYRLDCL